MKRRKKISFEFFSIFLSVNDVDFIFSSVLSFAVQFVCSAVFCLTPGFPFVPIFCQAANFILCLFV